MRPCLLGVLVFGSLPIGCGSGDAAPASPGPDAPGDAGNSDAGRGESGASGTPDSSTPDSSTPDSGTAKAGFVGVTSRATEVATVFANSVSAGFFDGPGYSYGKGCRRQVIKACAVLLCDFANGGDQMPPAGTAESAGPITLGGTTPEFSLEYDPATMQYRVLPAVPGDRLLFAGGATITFTAKGGDVAAFTESVVAPTPLEVTSPALPGGALSIDTSKDLVFTWTGSSVGMLAFNVRTSTTSSTTMLSSSFVSCQFPASALTGTIPTSLLLNLRRTDATTSAALTTDLSSTKEVVAGDHSVHLAVGSVATQTDGKTPYAANQVMIR